MTAQITRVENMLRINPALSYNRKNYNDKFYLNYLKWPRKNYGTISLDLIFPAVKTIALQGVPTGNMNA